MSIIRLWILKILDGFFSFLGEILMFFGVFAFLSTRSLSLVMAAVFLMFLGQMAGINAVRYEDRKKLKFFSLEVMESIGRQFAYPVLIFLFYVLNRSELLLALAFAFTLTALIRSVAILYKARVIGAMGI